MDRWEEVIRLKKEGMTKITQSQQSNYWREIMEDKSAKRQQQGLTVPKTDSFKPPKPLITDKYKNRMYKKKLNRINNFNKELL